MAKENDLNQGFYNKKDQQKEDKVDASKAQRVWLHRIVKVFLVVLIAAALSVAGYIGYLESGYYRIADNVPCEKVGALFKDSTPLEKGKVYSASTYNIGFGAYIPDFTFFMDKGTMVSGQKHTGTESRSRSYESTMKCTEGNIEAEKLCADTLGVDTTAPDFMVFQEADLDSDRSWHVNQVDLLCQGFSNYMGSYASNFHTGFLMYPPTRPHGCVSGGILTLSDVAYSSSIRRSYPISQQWPTKYFDLDRCFQVTRYPVEDGHELVLINSHMSAYDKNGEFKAKQLALIGEVMSEELRQGNYIVAGGDWNHALCGSVDLYPSQQLRPDWVGEFDDTSLPEGFRVVRAENLESVPTCRGVDIPYEKGVTYTTTVDGFIVSNNVEASAINVDTGFSFSDHNPVAMTFKLI